MAACASTIPRLALTRQFQCLTAIETAPPSGQYLMQRFHANNLEQATMKIAVEISEYGPLIAASIRARCI